MAWPQCARDLSWPPHPADAPKGGPAWSEYKIATNFAQDRQLMSKIVGVINNSAFVSVDFALIYIMVMRLFCFCVTKLWPEILSKIKTCVRKVLEASFFSKTVLNFDLCFHNYFEKKNVFIGYYVVVRYKDCLIFHHFERFYKSLKKKAETIRKQTRSCMAFT